MNISKIIKLGFLSVATMATMTSCSEWLKVDLEDSILRTTMDILRLSMGFTQK